MFQNHLKIASQTAPLFEKLFFCFLHLLSPPLVFFEITLRTLVCLCYSKIAHIFYKQKGVSHGKENQET